MGQSSSCPEVTELELFLDGKLSARERNELGSHVDACRACRELLGEVRENLQFAGTVRKAMARPEAGDSANTKLPDYIGSYRIIREIGRGGMGIVYEAEQPEPRRSVALKVIHAGLGFDGRIERMFRREAQVLGRLTHPSIASIYEAGRATDGRSYFAMELVSGVSLTEFARRENLEIPGRLELFSHVCEAIAFAHQRGVIHRDLKPSNILVDSAGVPKVLDFGLAKILEIDSQEPAHTAVTEEGRIQGTLPYMSPEQVRGDLNDIDVRSDVYSLGVVLHELLSGKLPYSIDRSRLTEAARTICDQTPLRLSTIDRRFYGDIETIVLKALEKEPDRRYSSAAAFAEDITRYLFNQPILARPPTLTYQLRKLITRHKVSAALLVAIFLLLIGFGVSMSVLYTRSQANLARAREAEAKSIADADRARYEASVANQIKDFLVNMFTVSDPDVAKGKTLTARQLLDWAANRAHTQLNTDPRVQATVMQTIGRVYNNLGMYDEATPLLREAVAKWRTVAPDSKNEAESAYELGNSLRSRGQLAEAQEQFENALRIIRAKRMEDEIHLLPMMQRLVQVQELRGDLDGAEIAMNDIIKALRSSPHGAVGLPGALNTMGGILCQKEKYSEAIPLLREALTLTNEPGFDSMMTRMRLEGNLAWILVQSNQDAEAEVLIRKTLNDRRKIYPATHPDIATSLITLGVVHLHKGDPASAEPLFREALQIREKALSTDKATIAEAKGFVGEALHRSQKYPEAEQILLAAFELITSKETDAPAAPRSRAEAATRLAKLYDAMTRPDDARHWRDIANQQLTAAASKPSGQ